jgi:hypothetical protein
MHRASLTEQLKGGHHRNQQEISEELRGEISDRDFRNWLDGPQIGLCARRATPRRKEFLSCLAESIRALQGRIAGLTEARHPGREANVITPRLQARVLEARPMISAALI